MNCLRPEHPWARRTRNARLTIRGTSRVTMRNATMRNATMRNATMRNATMRNATMRIAAVAEPDPA